MPKYEVREVVLSQPEIGVPDEHKVEGTAAERLQQALDEAASELLWVVPFGKAPWERALLILKTRSGG